MSTTPKRSPGLRSVSCSSAPGCGSRGAARRLGRRALTPFLVAALLLAVPFFLLIALDESLEE